MKTVQTLIALGVAALPLAGCGTLTEAMNFKADASSGVDPGTALVWLAAPEGGAAKSVAPAPSISAATLTNQALAHLKTQDPALATAVNTCAPPKAASTPAAGVAPAIAPAVVAIVAGLAEGAYNIWADQQQRKIDAIVASAQQTYAATIVVDPEMLASSKCVIVTRFEQKAGVAQDAGFVAVLEVVHMPTSLAGDAKHPAEYASFVLHPTYVRAIKAVAVTKEAKPPHLTVALSVAIKAVGNAEGRAGVPTLMPSGVGSVEIPAMEMGADAAAACKDGQCGQSDLIPYPTRRGALSLTVAVTEQGVTGFDDKAASAELAAIKAALGPALSDAINKQWGN